MLTTIYGWLAWASAHPFEVIGLLVLVMALALVLALCAAILVSAYAPEPEDHPHTPAMPGPKSTRRRVS